MRLSLLRFSFILLFFRLLALLAIPVARALPCDPDQLPHEFLEEGTSLLDDVRFFNTSAQSDPFHFYEEKMEHFFNDEEGLLRLGTPGEYHYEILGSSEKRDGLGAIPFLSEADIVGFLCYRDTPYEKRNAQGKLLEEDIDPALKSNQLFFHLATSEEHAGSMMVPEIAATGAALSWSERLMELGGWASLFFGQRGIAQRAHSLEENQGEEAGINFLSPYQAELNYQDQDPHTLHHDHDLPLTRAMDLINRAASNNSQENQTIINIMNPHIRTAYRPGYIQDYVADNPTKNSSERSPLDQLPHDRRAIALASSPTSALRRYDLSALEEGRLQPYPSSNTGATQEILTERSPLLGHLHGADRTAAPSREATSSPSLHSFWETPIQQVSHSREVAQEAVNTLKKETKAIQVIVDLINGPARAKATMACLRCFNLVDTNIVFTSLMSVNGGANFGSKKIILNDGRDGAPPFAFSVPSDDPSQPTQIITSPITPQGLKSNIKGICRCPARKPTPEENTKVRTLILEAFEDYFGAETACRCLPDFMSEENKGQPVTILYLQEPFGALYDRYSDEDHPEHIALKARAQQLESPSTLFPGRTREEQNGITIDNTTHQRSLAAAEKAISYSSQEVILRGLYYSAETLARGAGVAGGALLGGITGVVAGGIIAGITGDMQVYSRMNDPKVDYIDIDQFIIMFMPAVGILFFPCLGKSSYDYLRPNIPLQKAAEAFTDFRNRNTLIPQALDALHEAQAKDQELLATISAFFNQLPSSSIEAFHTEILEELQRIDPPNTHHDLVLEPGESPQVSESNESKNVSEPTPPRSLEEVQTLFLTHFENRIKARTSLIDYITEQISGTTPKGASSTQSVVTRSSALGEH